MRAGLRKSCGHLAWQVPATLPPPEPGSPTPAPARAPRHRLTPPCRQFSPDRNDMMAQLKKAWPIHTYPLVVLTPDGGVAVAAGKNLVRALGAALPARLRAAHRRPSRTSAASPGTCSWPKRRRADATTQPSGPSPALPHVIAHLRPLGCR